MPAPLQALRARGGGLALQCAARAMALESRNTRPLIRIDACQPVFQIRINVVRLYRLGLRQCAFQPLLANG